MHFWNLCSYSNWYVTIPFVTQQSAIKREQRPQQQQIPEGSQTDVDKPVVEDNMKNIGLHTRDELNQPDGEGRVLVNVNHPPKEVCWQGWGVLTIWTWQKWTLSAVLRLKGRVRQRRNWMPYRKCLLVRRFLHVNEETRQKLQRMSRLLHKWMLMCWWMSAIRPMKKTFS